MERFRAPVTIEGSTGVTRSRNLRVTVPKTTMRRLISFTAPGWVRLHVDGFEPFFGWARRPPSRSSVDMGLPRRLFPMTLGGQEIEAFIEDARPYRAPLIPRPGVEGFDWLPFVTEHYFPTETVNGRLLLHNRYEEPFAIKRVTPIEPTYRLLGLYQAEGAKAESVLDFRIGSTNPALLRHFSELLGMLGLGPDRQRMEICRAHGEEKEKARKEFEIPGVEVAGERFRSTQSTGNHTAADLGVRNSLPLRRLIAGALAKVFAEEFPSKEAAREYALGWLDGDGTITILQPIEGRRGHVLELRLAGYEDEQDVVLKALHYGFDWEEKGCAFTSIRAHRARTLNVREAAELAVAGAFSFSMSRARLLYEIERRCAGRPRHMTEEDLRYARNLLETLRPEMETLRRLVPPERCITGIKGVPYPLTVL